MWGFGGQAVLQMHFANLGSVYVGVRGRGEKGFYVLTSGFCVCGGSGITGFDFGD